MAGLSERPLDGGEINGNRIPVETLTLRELVTITAGTTVAALNIKLPPYCRVLHSAVKLATSITYGSNGTATSSGTASGIGLFRTRATGTNTTSLRTTAMVYLNGTSQNTEAYDVGASLAASAAPPFGNLDATEGSLILLPVDPDGTNTINYQTATTNSYEFATAGDVEVVVVVEKFSMPEDYAA